MKLSICVQRRVYKIHATRPEIAWVQRKQNGYYKQRHSSVILCKTFQKYKKNKLRLSLFLLGKLYQNKLRGLQEISGEGDSDFVL